MFKVEQRNQRRRRILGFITQLLISSSFDLNPSSACWFYVITARLKRQKKEKRKSRGSETLK